MFPASAPQTVKKHKNRPFQQIQELGEDLFIENEITSFPTVYPNEISSLDCVVLCRYVVFSQIAKNDSVRPIKKSDFIPRDF